MDIKKLQTLVIDALEDVKGHDIRAYDTVHLTSLFDRMAIASGTSNRQTKALAASVRDKVKENGGTIVSIEGEDTGEWVLVDLGDMVVHIMQPAIRDYYRLEEIWGEKEIKLGAAKRTSKRSASEDASEAPVRKTTRHIAASQTTVDEDEPKKPARKTPAKTATKTAAKTAKIPTGGRVKVATPKSASVAPKKAPAKAPAKRAPARKKAAE
ncbi:ribosome silencing factor [Noviherbaspirillum sp.]|uniref:ribosome silencing factor n=1 Tax=Noviherbaspirillum sp. TaxID=1926288 RepID=UPI002FE397C2